MVSATEGMVSRGGLVQRTIIRLVLATVLASSAYQIVVAANLNDFQTFLDAGRAVATGADPYPLPAMSSTNLNPPISLLVFRWLAFVEPRTAYRAWQAASALLFGLAFLWLARTEGMILSGSRWLWAWSLGGLWYTLLMGQLYAVLLLLCVGAWSLLGKGRPIAAGLLIGLLVAIKPNFAVWPLLLLLSGSLLVGLLALGVAAVATLIPLFIFGPRIYLGWFGVLNACPFGALSPNVSLAGAMARIGLPGLGTGLSVALVAGASLLALRCRPAPLQASALALPTALLASPIAWAGYTVVLIPIFFSRRWAWPLQVAAGLLVVPTTLVFVAGKLSPLGLILSGSIYFAAVSLVLYQAIADIARPGVPVGCGGIPQAQSIKGPVE